jgi:hypothetical protein
VPSLGSTPVSDGDRISVRYGRKLTVTVDGETTERWTTATTVDGALTELNIRADGAAPDGLAFAEPGPSGPHPGGHHAEGDVTVVADGKTRSGHHDEPDGCELLNGRRRRSAQATGRRVPGRRHRRHRRTA